MSYPGYPAPYGYGAPQPVYGAPVYAAAPVYGAPMYAPAPMYAAPMQVVVPPQPVAYTPGLYQYNVAYIPGQPFVVPYNLPPHLAAKMYQASAAFRAFDRNWSGTLDKKEWKRALRHLGFYLPKSQGKWWFRMVDRDCSGRISEREFCEWWLQVHPY